MASKFFSHIFLLYTILLGGTILITAYAESGGLKVYFVGITIILLGILPAAYISREAIIDKFQSIKIRILQAIQAKKEDLQRYWNGLNLYSWGKITFWIIFLLPLISVLMHLLSPAPNIVQIFNPAQENSIFSSSLILLANMIGFVFIILIFVIQNTTQEYSPDLSKEIYRDNYLIKIFSVLLLIAIYNLSGQFFQLQGIFQSLGYILTLTSFLYLISLSLITIRSSLVAVKGELT